MKTNDEIIPRIEANFGRGEIAITTGTHGGRPCVYLAPARMPAAVGAPVSNAAEGLPSDAMREDESVLTFPTAEQAELVKRALAGQLTTVDKPGEVVSFRIVGKHGPYPWVDGKPDPEPEFIVGEGERLELAYGQPRSLSVPDGWKVERAPDVLGQPAMRLASPDGEESLFGIFAGERIVRDFLMSAFPLAAAPAPARSES